MLSPLRLLNASIVAWKTPLSKTIPSPKKGRVLIVGAIRESPLHRRVAGLWDFSGR